jgi:D-sedoheptulose 7-phosphate isomerase
MNIDIKDIINEHILTANNLLDDSELIEEISSIVIDTLKTGNTIFLCGNGGSASDSIHIAAEIVGKFNSDNRKSLPAISLASNQSNITSIGNDFGFNSIFSRQLEGLGKSKDLLIALSTSGNSENVINALKSAEKLNIKRIGLTGLDGGKMLNHCDLILKVSSNNTARIQEMHIMIGHIICQLIDNSFN